MDKVSRFLKTVFAASALSFIGLLISYVAVLFLRGHEVADNVWRSPFFVVPIWIAALFIAFKYLKD